MQLSSDFNVKLMGPQISLRPLSKSDVTDVHFNKIISAGGAHQRLIDCSRCTRIKSNSFNLFSLCTFINFIDLSFTNCLDISPIIQNCRFLKSLNISGLRLVSFEPLEEATSLELLNLCKTNITSLVSLKNLTKLRYLDLGQTEVINIDCIVVMTKLAYLSLDSCDILSESSVLHTLPELKSIKILNIAENKFSKDWQSVLFHSLKNEICLQNESKR